MLLYFYCFSYFVYEREKKSTIYAILYERINVDLNTTSSVRLFIK